MKKLLCYIFFLSCIFNATAQKMPIDYFDEANANFEAKDYEQAELGYRYITEHHPRNELYPRAYYNLGYLYFVRKDYDSATSIFKNIIASNFNEKEDLGGGIMSDPYTNYRHRACKLLFETYEIRTVYDSALHYLSLADTVYPYEHFCGNASVSNEIHMTLNYAQLYRKMGNPDLAINTLLPGVFAYYGLADNSEIIAELRTLFKGKKNLKKQLDEAITNMYIKTFKDSGEETTFHFIKFMGIEIVEPTPYSDDLENKTVSERIKDTKFYMMIADLSN